MTLQTITACLLGGAKAANSGRSTVKTDKTGESITKGYNSLKSPTQYKKLNTQFQIYSIIMA